MGLDSGVKAALVPYMTGYESRNSHGEVQVDLKFHPQHHTFSMRLTTEEGTVRYNNIRLPESVREIVPVVAAKNQQNKNVFNVLKGVTVYPKCVVGDHAIETFSKYEMNIIMQAPLSAEDYERADRIMLLLI